MEKGVGVGCFEKAQKRAKLQDDEVAVTKQMSKLEMKKGKKDLANGKLMRNLIDQTRGLNVWTKLDCPERSPAQRTVVVFLDLGFWCLWYPHLTLPTGRWGFHQKMGSRTGAQCAMNFLSP